MPATINLGDVSVDVLQKDIKNVHLSVHPPTGRVSISAPLRMELDAIRVFAVSKLSWIKKQQAKLREQERETPREYIDRESHYAWGKRYLLKVIELNETPEIRLQHSTIQLQVRPGADRRKKQALIKQWHREQVKQAAAELLLKWEPLIGVSVAKCYVQSMKTRWGSCNTNAGNIRLNSELAKKPPKCLEYILVHELIHLIEPTHNQRFIDLMDQHLPDWQFRRDVLNRLPVRHEDWGY